METRKLMKLKDYYVNIFEEPVEEPDKNIEMVNIGNKNGWIFNSDEFYAVYNQNDQNDTEKIYDLLKQAANERECKSSGDVMGTAFKVSRLLNGANFKIDFGIKDDANLYTNFRNSRKKLFDELKVHNFSVVVEEKFIDNYLDSYQNLLIYILKHLANCKLEREKTEIKQFLSQFMLIDCVKDYRENNIYIAILNPLMLLQSKRVHALKNVILQNDKNDNKKNLGGLYNQLVAIIAEKQFPNKFYSDSVIYTVDKRNCDLEEYGVQVARSRGTMSTLNNINSVRIIGKVLRVLEHKKDTTKLKIAYFGSFYDTVEEEDKDKELNVENYFNIKKVSDEYKHIYKKKFPQLDIMRFEACATRDNLFYCSASKKNSQKKYYDLQEMSSLEELMIEYDMILLLDEGYYYKKERQDKPSSFDELYAVQSYIEQTNEGKNSLGSKWDILAAWLNWGFSFWNDKSGHYEFDKNLYDNICNISNICNENLPQRGINCNAYIYISEGKKIGIIDLKKSNVCEEELYYGHKMKVSHFPKKTKLEGLEDLWANEKAGFQIQIEAWKLFRSLYDESYDYLRQAMLEKEQCKEDQSKEDLLIMIYDLRHIAIIWDYRELVMDSQDSHQIDLVMTHLECKVIQEDLARIKIEDLKKFIKSLFEMAFAEKTDVVGQYIREVIMETVKASAYRMEDFFFANFLQYFRGKCEVSCRYDEDGEKARQHLSAQTRQSIHGIVDQLDHLHLRDLPRGGLFVKQEIIEKIEGCGGALSVEQFDKILKKMKEIQDGGFNSSILLKHNIDILCPEQGELYNEWG